MTRSFTKSLRCVYSFCLALCLHGVVDAAPSVQLKEGKMVFAGYSGKPEQDKQAGFSVVGPCYGAQEAHLKESARVGMPVMAQISFPKSIFESPLDAAFIDAEVAKKIALFSEMATVYAWCIEPEEVRSWKPREMELLKLVAESIRKHDKQKRPIFHYQPNHRDGKTLKPSSAYIDIVGKGCYVNSAGYKDKRAWVRWSVEQMLKSMEGSEYARSCWVMPELCKDPEPEEEKNIRRWARHDVYLGLGSGAKGVLIWSLFPRKEVKKTWSIWYEAYAECSRELNGHKALASIFLEGKPVSNYSVAVDGKDVSSIAEKRSDSNLEANTSRPNEGYNQAHYPVTVKAWSWKGAHYVLLVNSMSKACTVELKGIPANATGRLVLTDHPRTERKFGALELEPWEVVMIKFVP